MAVTKVVKSVVRWGVMLVVEKAVMMVAHLERRSVESWGAKKVDCLALRLVAQMEGTTAAYSVLKWVAEMAVSWVECWVLNLAGWWVCKKVVWLASSLVVEMV